MATSIPRVSLLLLAASALSACVSIAPPVRTGHYGAPARVEAGEVEVAGEVAYGPDLAGGPVFGYGISDLVAVEGGVEIGQRTRVIGWAGARLTPLRPRQRDFAFVLDVEGGAGAGVGGRLCNQSACESTIQNLHRPAGGGYFGWFPIDGGLSFTIPTPRSRRLANQRRGQHDR